MTVPFPLDAFDSHQPVRLRGANPVDRARLVSIGLTLAFHVVIIGAALTAVQVSRARAPRELSVSVTPERIKPPKDEALPIPQMTKPTIVTVPPPDVSIQTMTPPPVTAQPPAAKPAPPALAAPKAAPGGESRESFLGRLLGQLNRFKQYPRSARQARIEGVVMLHFVMDATGHITSFEIAKSSGRPVLDAEALALIQRAQPLPAIPADYPTRTLDAIVPIEFYLDR